MSPFILVYNKPGSPLVNELVLSLEKFLAPWTILVVGLKESYKRLQYFVNLGW